VNSGEIIELNCGNQLFFDKATKALYGVICNKPGNYNSSYFLKVNPTNWTAEKFYFPKRIRSFCQLENGVFWLICANNTSDSQLYSFDPATNQIQFFTTSEEQNPLGDGMPTFLQKSKFGHLWLGTMAGLYAIDLIEKTVDFYNQDSILSGNQVQVLLELEDKKVLIGTNNGVNYIDFNTFTKEVFNKRRGLSASSIYGIEKGREKNTFWISTISGLNFFDLNKKSFLKFFEQDGFSANEFNRFAHFQDIAGRYYFGGINGLNIFKQENLLITPAAPKVELTKIEYFDPFWSDYIFHVISSPVIRFLI